MKMHKYLLAALTLTLAGAAVWANAPAGPRKDSITLELEPLGGDRVRIQVTRPGQARKVLEVTVGVKDGTIRVSDKQEPGVTTRLTYEKDDEGGQGKLLMEKWLDGSGTVRSAEPDHDGAKGTERKPD